MRWYGRLRRTSEIAFVRRRGRAIHLTILVAYGAQGTSAPVRVGVTVSKAVGNAVIRNRVRRRIRGALDALPRGTETTRYLFVAKPGAGTADYATIAREVAIGLERLGSGRR